MTVAACACALVLIGTLTALVRTAGSDAGSPAAQAMRRITRGWAPVVDRAVGFRALLPSQPVDSSLSLPASAGGRLAVRVARADHRIVIERIAGPASSVKELTQVFHSAADVLATGTGFQVESERATSFRGQVGREAVYLTDTGVRYQALIFVATAGEYLIAAPARYFEPVTAGFHVLP